MSKLQAMREQREVAGKVILQLRDKIKSEDRDFNSEERAEWEKANKDFDDLNRKVEAIERGDAVVKAMEARKDNNWGDGRSRPRGAVRAMVQDLALQAWFRRQSGRPLSDDHQRACRAIGFRPGSKYINIRLNPTGETRAQSVGTGSAGGNTVPQGFVSTLEVALKEWNAVRTVAEIIRTDGGNPLPWPTVNDTANPGTLLAENTSVGASVDLTFGVTTFNGYKFQSGLILVSSELEQDNGVDLVNRIAELAGERLGRGQEGYFTTGTGSSQPQGIVTGATLGLTAASSTAIAADELFTLYHSVDPAYRRDPSFGWMMHDNVAMALRKLKDSQNRYLWEMDIQKGQPAQLLGRPVTINQSMASTIATGNKTLLIGALSKMKVRDAGVVRIRRLVERYGDVDQVGYIGFMRSDSKLLDAGTHPIKYLQQL